MSNNWISYSNYFEIVGLKTVFTTRYTLSNSVDNDRMAFTELVGLNPKNLIIPKQTHSSNISVCETPGNYPDTDAIIAINQDLVLSIQVADCFPIFIVDIKTHYTALVHAGWRGLVANIIPKTIQEMIDLGCKKEQLKIVLGPSIKSCCFEVRTDVVHLFPNDSIQANPNKEGKYWIDLLRIAKNQLYKVGIELSNIYLDHHCTSCQWDSFYSYRRDGKKAGRMLGLIGWV